jgi:hypothetical protein
VGPCYHDIERHRAADGADGLQIWRIAANVLKKAVADNRQWAVLRLGDWARCLQLLTIVRNVTRRLGIGWVPFIAVVKK